MDPSKATQPAAEPAGAAGKAPERKAGAALGAMIGGVVLYQVLVAACTTSAPLDVTDVTVVARANHLEIVVGGVYPSAKWYGARLVVRPAVPDDGFLGIECRGDDPGLNFGTLFGGRPAPALARVVVPDAGVVGVRVLGRGPAPIEVTRDRFLR